MKERGRKVGSIMPAVDLTLAALAAVAVMPTVLRPPPDQQQSSAALSPNARPDDQAESILQSLQQVAPRTAGATGGQQQDAAPVTTSSTLLAAARGQCFGDPPRQTESAYSPPCRAAFTGENGGDTAPLASGGDGRRHPSVLRPVATPADRQSTAMSV